ncbi:Polyamine transporter [Wickerhamomyces ciferrii]|uniref:Polyamine transporter n=1 Tax=Wickerhamomyces ciferrii (strain ATCC 14091 / BCRC 22168 / CBS 111 / JCM 3599 / NBRC 0793 / NRRL Y-1031 F-60-10) TaxID=1206466 RepID=K0KEF3_WICCF|nr:Polyamine transporter [Wickerhamomyces ciferrii]CCH43515.1 Polyamine transporter [Wickerhamomyces ciferrii]
MSPPVEPEQNEASYTHRLIHHISEAIENDMIDHDVQVEKFKYEQELNKNLTITTVIGLGFGLMSAPLSLGTTMNIGLIDGGPATIIGGYLIVYIFSILCSLSLGEITSKYPIELHGGAAIIAKPKYSLICSWFTGFFLLIGNWTMSTSITFAGAQFMLSVIGIVDSDYETDAVLTVVVFYIVVTICGLINLKFSRHLELINKICVYWIIYAILFIDILLLLFSPRYHSLKYIFTFFDNTRSGWPAPMAFIIGFQQASFTLQGFGLLPAVSEEVKDAERTVPKGMTLAVLLAGGAGFIFLIPILAVLPEISLLVDQNQSIMPIVLIFKLATNSVVVSFFLVIMIMGNLLFSGIGSIQTSSRAVYSMSRDGALPYGDFWTYVHSESVLKVPKNSIYLSMAVSYLLGLLSLVSTAAFNAFIGAAVISLCAASLIPITSLVLGGRKKVRGAAFKLKYVGFIINIISMCWLLFTIFVLSLPPQLPITGSSMNYASVVFILFVILASLLWVVWGKKNFHGPLVDNDNNERVDAVQLQDVDPQGSYRKLDEQKFEKLDSESLDREAAAEGNSTLNTSTNISDEQSKQSQ